MVCATTPEETLIIRFREDGNPLEPFIRFLEPPKRLKLRFYLSEAFVPEERGISVEVKMPHWKSSIDRAFVEEACDEIELAENESGTIQFHLKTSSRCYNPGFIQLPPRRLDDLKIVTLVSKWMGGAEERWFSAFQRCRELGYSMIHFTPLQERGHSNSPYSIKDQLTFADDLFSECNLTRAQKQAKFAALLAAMKQQFQLSGMIDMVWNHTACDSLWLLEHPEAGYNLENSPHLKPAFALDELILSFSAELEDDGRGCIQSEADLLALMQEFKQAVLPRIKLWEYFVIDVAGSERALEDLIKSGVVVEQTATVELERAVQFDGKHERFSFHMNLELVCQHFATKIEAFNRAPIGVKDSILSDILAEYRHALDELNLPKYQKYDDIVTRACQNIFHRVQYERLAENGPKLGLISRRNPLAATYFTRIDGHALANNGWIWNADPFQNFAEAGSEAYLLRDVIVWGDCVKLRYGRSAEDNLWLWNHMATYTKQMAALFDAFRIDNCHSTPIHVAEFLLYEARKVKPDLYVCAELFTGSAERDMQFVTRLGIDSLIREAMVSWDVDEIVRLALAYGGKPFGSFRGGKQYSHVPHNIFFDCTHDNEPPCQKRLPQDTLSNSAIVAFSCCATGSTFGYDQFIPQHLNIVSERRKYDLQAEAPMQQLKSILNDLHQEMNAQECDEIFARKYANDVVLIARNNPKTHCGYALITRCAYQPTNQETNFEVIDFPCCDVEFVLSAEVESLGNYTRDREFINGIPAKIQVNKGHCDWFSSTHNSHGSTLELKRLNPGSLIILKQRIITPLPRHLDMQELKSITAALSLIDLNYLLYKCEAEERDEFPEIGAYNVPGHGALPFCGFEGAHLLMESAIVPFDALEHVLCENIRQGSWLLDYLLARLERKGFARFAAWFKEASAQIYQLPPYLRPLHFWKLLHGVVEELRARILAQMSPKLAGCSEFARHLALHSVQLVGQVPSTGLAPAGLSASLSAGLPHFATHHMRCWGRDIFIAFRGLFLHTGRFEEGRAHLLAFAGCCLLGLIPNLLDSARRPRFNARDATWWFLAALQDYCKFAPEGHDILRAAVALRFPDDEYIDFTDNRIFSKSKTLASIVQSILDAHANGIHFREWNAGPALDSVMQSEGFQIDIFTDWRTGFIFGGNRYNCGTWMDKMGESELAGNRGIPSTPRDGAAVEIVALLKMTLDWLAVLPQYGFTGVRLHDQNGRFVSFADWAALIEAEFERHFYIPESPAEDAQFCLDSSLIKRRGIYKDTFGSTNASSDYQMRPNHLLAMAIAPSLFQSRRARRALALAERHLTGPLGMRTLDSEDPAYRPIYQNSLDCTDPLLARGANYHNGPEWLWCMGFYLRAWLTFNLSTADTKSARKLVLTRLQPHRDHLFTAGKAGLPELTNANGQSCEDSCWTQAWSMACILDVLMVIEGDEAFESAT